MLFNKKILYIVEDANWSIKWDGTYITKNLKKIFKINSCILYYSKIKIIGKVKNKIIHFGSRSTFLPNQYKLLNGKNKIVFTWFHGTDEDREYIEELTNASKVANIIHTSCEISKNQLINWGVEEEKIEIVPLGVDLSLFKRVSLEEKNKIKDLIGIPVDHICIGSFQKDGNGWGEGITPKLIKGPDVLCSVIEKLNKKFPVFVLLTGPARGYVKNRLESNNIPFKHCYLEDYLDIPKYYNALDYYIISSRAEGGPKAVLECFASGIPFVSTRVGMANDIIVNNANGLISEIDDVDDLTNNLTMLIEDSNLREKLVLNGIETVKDFDWKKITEQYYYKIYSKLL
ncbi:MAG: glycosyltransferase family 4 protein [Actinobacteria bacterium]|nr:glycosyltransferase family 4 protein [Chloroflexota bacterium]MBE3128907.1 glycosyltransferase family 4 protein [Actinomycetota bacterium]